MPNAKEMLLLLQRSLRGRSDYKRSDAYAIISGRF